MSPHYNHKRHASLSIETKILAAQKDMSTAQNPDEMMKARSAEASKRVKGPMHKYLKAERSVRSL